MKITISVGGRFHAFALAKYFQDQGHLEQLLTSYPKFEVVKYGIERKKVRSIIVKELIQRGYKFLFNKYPNAGFAADLYDKIASVLINKKSDVYIIWSSYAEITFNKLRKHNSSAVLIVERGSTHIVHQAETMIKLDFHINKRVIKKELAEYSMADYISVLSTHSKQTFISNGIPGNRIIVNPLGVNVLDFTFQPRNFESNPFTVGFVGSMSKRKNVSQLISAIGKLVEENLNIRLLLVGNIDDDFDQSVLDNRFTTYQPSVKETDLYKWYAKMHLFILPSLEDGFGMVVPQAMATGLPVVVSDEAGASELVVQERNGYIFSPGDFELCEQIIRKLYHDRNSAKKMGDSAANDVQNFTWSEYGKRYLNTLIRIADA